MSESDDRAQDNQDVELEEKVRSLEERNAKLTNTLKEARNQLGALREEVERLGQPPSGYGVLLATYDDGTVDVFTAGRKMRVVCSPNIDVSGLRAGQTIRLNEAMTVVEVGPYSRIGELCTLREIIHEDVKSGEPRRAIIVSHTDEEQIVLVADSIDVSELKAGDTLLVNTKEGFVFEKVAKPKAEQLVLEEVLDISYDDIGGLKRQVEQIRDAVELPFLHK
ncbi:MAG: proteasome ATPase, partial [Candidatus Saccharibacteria bacterium]|nr:proteasome ATPase [Candidatus Saccharibacteria bacterium]